MNKRRKWTRGRTRLKFRRNRRNERAERTSRGTREVQPPRWTMTMAMESAASTPMLTSLELQEFRCHRRAHCSLDLEEDQRPPVASTTSPVFITVLQRTISRCKPPARITQDWAITVLTTTRPRLLAAHRLKSMDLKPLEPCNIQTTRELAQLRTTTLQTPFPASSKAKVARIRSTSEEVSRTTAKFPIIAINRDSCNRQWTMPSRITLADRARSLVLQEGHWTSCLSMAHNLHSQCNSSSKKWMLSTRRFAENVTFLKWLIPRLSRRVTIWIWHQILITYLPQATTAPSKLAAKEDSRKTSNLTTSPTTSHSSYTSSFWMGRIMLKWRQTQVSNTGKKHSLILFKQTLKSSRMIERWKRVICVAWHPTRAQRNSILREIITGTVGEDSPLPAERQKCQVTASRTRTLSKRWYKTPMVKPSREKTTSSLTIMKASLLWTSRSRGLHSQRTGALLKSRKWVTTWEPPSQKRLQPPRKKTAPFNPDKPLRSSITALLNLLSQPKLGTRQKIQTRRTRIHSWFFLILESIEEHTFSRLLMGMELMESWLVSMSRPYLPRRWRAQSNTPLIRRKSTKE